jgi:hypothetical protein
MKLASKWLTRGNRPGWSQTHSPSAAAAEGHVRGCQGVGADGGGPGRVGGGRPSGRHAEVRAAHGNLGQDPPVRHDVHRAWRGPIPAVVQYTVVPGVNVVQGGVGDVRWVVIGGCLRCQMTLPAAVSDACAIQDRSSSRDRSKLQRPFRLAASAWPRQWFLRIDRFGSDDDDQPQRKVCCRTIS